VHRHATHPDKATLVAYHKARAVQPPNNEP
jgi:hypothetical protein